MIKTQHAAFGVVHSIAEHWRDTGCPGGIADAGRRWFARGRTSRIDTAADKRLDRYGLSGIATMNRDRMKELSVAAKRHETDPIGPYYRFAALVIEPFMMLNTRRDRRGVENLERVYPPNDGIIVVANHMSWFDPMNIAHVLWDSGRPPRFLAKDKLFELPLFGRLMNGAGQIPVYRESDDPASAIRDAIAAINSGKTVVIYPEGTMTRDPDFWPMTGRTGAAQLAFATGAPVIPLAQWGPQEVMKPYSKEFKIWPPKTMHTLVGEPVDLDDLREKKTTKAVLNEATDRIIKRITELMEELRGEKAPEERLDYRKWREERKAKKAKGEGDKA